MKVVVTGSLGNVGKPLAKDLFGKGHSVTVITSDPKKKDDIEALGAVSALGSIGDAEFLTATFEGADAVFAMVPPNFAEPVSRDYYRRIGSSYAKAIAASGVKRVVHLSSIGADLDAGTGFILGSHDVEGILGELPDVSLTHLRPGYFYTNLYNFAGMIKGVGFIASNYGDGDRIVLADPRDIADAAAEELQSIEGEKIRYIVSSETTCSEVAKTLGHAIGEPGLTWRTITDEQTLQGLQQSGMPPHAAANFVEMGDSIHSGILFSHYDANKPSGKGKISLEDFAKEFAAGF